VAARDVEALNDDVVGGAKQNHPVWYAGGSVNDDVSGFAHRLEVDVVPIGGARLIFHDKTRVRARHDCDEIASLCSIGRLLQGPVDGIRLVAADWAWGCVVAGVEIQAVGSDPSVS